MDNADKRKVRCCICSRSGRMSIVKDPEQKVSSRVICSKCDTHLFRGLYDFEKSRVISQAITLSKDEALPVSYAVNVVRRIYSLKEAKRRLNARKNNKTGKAKDLFDVGHRIKGSFQSKT